MEPARSVIKLLGGEKAVSKITGTAYTAPYRWQQPREKGGTGGTIPQRHHNALLAHARANHVRLTADDLLPRYPQTSHGLTVSSAANRPDDLAGEGASHG